MRQKLYPNRKVRTINIDNALWVTFGEVMKRENRSRSDFIEEKVKEHVNLHSAGNPQQRLDKIIVDGKPYRAPSKCWFCGKPPVMVVVFKRSRKEKAVCRVHADECLGTGKWMEKEVK